MPEVHHEAHVSSEMPTELFPVDLDRTESGQEPEPGKPPESSSCDRVV
jgi:hypothetical protein